MAEDFIVFENVKKVYSAGEVAVTALHDVSFSIARGEICVIVGESGAGKTTLLNILGGMDTLTEGKVLVDGAEVSAFSKRQLTGYRRQIGLLEYATALQPYSDGIPRENWGRPHGDRFDPETPDFSAALLLRDAGDLETETFVTGDAGTAEISLFYGVRNDSFSWTASHPFQADLVIRDREGKTVYTSSGQGSVLAYRGHTWGWEEQVSLPGGAYTAVVSVRALEDGPEPYYSNNTFTQVFTVVDPAGEKLLASLTGEKDGLLQFDVSAPFSVEYSHLYVRYGKGNAWSAWIDAEEKGAFSPGDADRAVFAAWLHRDGQSFCLQSDVVPLR